MCLPRADGAFFNEKGTCVALLGAEANKAEARDFARGL
jgi:hypothetical protein